MAFGVLVIIWLKESEKKLRKSPQPGKNYLKLSRKKKNSNEILKKKMIWNLFFSGFCMELATGFSVLLATKLGIPVSTTHSIVGAVTFVGLYRFHKIEKKLILTIAASWVVTLPICAALSGLFTWALNFILWFSKNFFVKFSKIKKSFKFFQIHQKFSAC